MFEDNSIAKEKSLGNFISGLSDFKIYATLCVLGFILYFKSLFFGFTYLDDNVLILGNLPFIQDMGNIFQSFAREVFNSLKGPASYYRPLMTLSLMPEAAIAGASPFLYHLVNLLIHIIASCLVFKLFFKLRYSKTISFFFALVFVVHPVLTQAVSWIPGRNDSLLALFALASFIFFIDFADSRKNIYAIWSGIFFALAIFTKETAILLPLIMSMYLWIENKLGKEILIKLSAGWMPALIVWFILRHFAFLNNAVPASLGDITISLFNNLPAALQFLGKVFLPFNLSVFPNIPDTSFVYGIAAAGLVLLVLSILSTKENMEKKNYLMIIFGLIWFAFFLVPSFIRADTTILPDFIDHRLYLPIIGIFIASAEIISVFENEPRFRKISPVVFAAIIVIFSGIAFFYQNNFSDRVSFWKNASQNSPHSPMAQKNMGAMYYLDGKYDLSLEYYKKALALNPYETMVRSNIGLILAGQGRYAEAEKAYLDEISFNPAYDGAHYNLGLLYLKTNHPSEARKEFEQTLKINPEYTDAKKALETLNSGSTY